MSTFWRCIGTTILVFLAIVVAPVVFVGLLIGFVIGQAMSITRRGLRRFYRA